MNPSFWSYLALVLNVTFFGYQLLPSELSTPITIGAVYLLTLGSIFCYVVFFYEDDSAAPKLEAGATRRGEHESRIAAKHLQRPISRMSDNDVVELTKHLLAILKERGVTFEKAASSNEVRDVLPDEISELLPDTESLVHVENED